VSTRIERLTTEISKVAPIEGVAIFPTGTASEEHWHTVTNFSTGELVRIDYQLTATAGEKSAGDNVAINFDLTQGLRVPRVLYSIWQDIGALTGAQKTAIATDLFSGTPPKVSQDTGPNAPVLLTLSDLQKMAALSTADKQSAQRSAISIFTLDNPTYLVHPPFDPTINVPGDELA